MSSRLVKKSLELFDDDLTDKASAKKKKSKSAHDPMSLISTKKKGVKKELRRLQKQHTEKHRQNRISQSVVDEYLSSYQEDHTEASVSSLCKLSKISKVENKAASTIVQHHLNLRKQDMIKKKETKKKKNTEQSVFTDEDFEKFFQEYNDPLNKT